MNRKSSKQFMKRVDRSNYIRYPLQGGRREQNITEVREQAMKNISDTSQKGSKEKPNPFAALSQLKQTQQQYELLKKRTQILKLKDQKNTHRYQLNQRKLILHNSIQQLTQLQKHQLQQWRISSQQKQQQQRITNLHQKLLHQRHMQDISETIKQTKLREYEERKEQAKSNEQRKKSMEVEVMQGNKQKVEKIKRLEEMARVAVESYSRGRMAQFRDKKYKETRYLEHKKAEKEVEIQKMIQLEMEMIERQSRSRLMVDNSTQRLKEILNPEFSLNKSKLSRSLFKEKPQLNQSPLISHQPDPKHPNQTDNNTTEKSSQLTQEPSFRSQKQKGFSLPEIKSARKYC